MCVCVSDVFITRWPECVCVREKESEFDWISLCETAQKDTHSDNIDFTQIKKKDNGNGTWATWKVSSQTREMTALKFLWKNSHLVFVFLC